MCAAPTERVGTYRSTETLAALVTVAVVAFVLATFLALWTVYSVNDLRASEGRDAADAGFQQRFPFLLPAPVLGVLGLWRTAPGSEASSRTCLRSGSASLG